VLGLIRLPSVPLPRRVLGRDSEKASTLAPDHRAVVECADDLRRFGVHQACRIEPLVRVVPVPPAVGEPLPETGAGHLPAELGPEAAARLAGAGGDCALDVAQLGLQVRLERAGDGGGKFRIYSRQAAQAIKPRPATL
jgi:hypothetical protein